MKRETRELIKNFQAEFAKKLDAAKQMYPDVNEVALGRICLKYAAREFLPMSPEYLKLDKDLALYL